MISDLLGQVQAVRAPLAGGACCDLRGGVGGVSGLEAHRDWGPHGKFKNSLNQLVVGSGFAAVGLHWGEA